jgi:hypothetical protein
MTRVERRSPPVTYPLPQPDVRVMCDYQIRPSLRSVMDHPKIWSRLMRILQCLLISLAGEGGQLLYLRLPGS